MRTNVLNVQCYSTVGRFDLCSTKQSRQYIVTATLHDGETRTHLGISDAADVNGEFDVGDSLDTPLEWVNHYEADE